MENQLQHYSWGSSDGIPSLVGFENPRGTPIAELWMGAHDSAPSTIKTNEGPIPLHEAIRDDPEFFLGSRCRKQFGDTLPYLFKVLSAAHPLSIQAHPDKAQAIAGWNRENRAGIPHTAPERNYHDKNHKPETILALSKFTAMCGFRPIEQTATLIRQTGIHELVSSIATLESNRDYRVFLRELWSLSKTTKKNILDALHKVLETTPQKTTSSLERHPLIAVRQLANEYPGDIGMLAPLYLNTVLLEPGEALFLPAGILHAYLSGTGLELMANSDNVLRGGLTKKHVDTEELLSVISPGAHIPQRILPISSEFISRYPTPAKEFELSIIQMEGTPLNTHFSAPSIILVTHGSLIIHDANVNSELLPRGSSVFIPAMAGDLTLSGEGIAYLATVPHTEAK